MAFFMIVIFCAGCAGFKGLLSSLSETDIIPPEFLGAAFSFFLSIFDCSNLAKYSFLGSTLAAVTIFFCMELFSSGSERLPSEIFEILSSSFKIWGLRVLALLLARREISFSWTSFSFFFESKKLSSEILPCFWMEELSLLLLKYNFIIFLIF